jgi:hypothetical protein
MVIPAGGGDVSIGEALAEALAEARHRAGLTVAQVGHQTGISEALITAVEGNDYSACGSDSYTRWYIRSIAQAVGTNPEPLIRRYNTGHSRLGTWLWRAWLVVVAVVVGWISFVVFQYHAGPHHAVTAASPARAHPVAHRHPGDRARGTPNPASAPARTLTPVSATAFGPDGGSQGDNGDTAHLAIDAHGATAWRTDWYTTAQLGSLYRGTGLLLDMGRPVTITAAQIALGSGHAARLQLRVGTAPALADLPPVAHAANAGGVVRLRLTRPAHGRYVLIWFTRLPPDPAGTFRASVHSLRLEGRT